MEKGRMIRTGNQDSWFRLLGGLFLLSTRLETIGNSHYYLGELTTKQWFLLISLLSLFESPPTVSQMAKEMGTSHQNVKVIATHLQRKGFVCIVKDSNDARISRIVPTEKCNAYNHLRAEISTNFINEIMRGFPESEIKSLEEFVYKLVGRVDSMMENMSGNAEPELTVK